MQRQRTAPPQHRTAEGIALVLVACTMFGSVPVMARLAYDHGAGTFTFLSGRYVLAGLALGIVVVLQDGGRRGSHARSRGRRRAPPQPRPSSRTSATSLPSSARR